MKFFKSSGVERKSFNSKKKVTLEFVLAEIDRIPSTEGNFIGLINDKNETIQFVKFKENSWLLDFPVIENDIYSYSLVEDDLTREKVKKIIISFFRGENWRTLCHLEKSDQKLRIQKNKRRMEFFKEIEDKGAEMTSEEVLTKKEFIERIETFPRSSNNTTFGIIAELSKPFLMIKNTNGEWEVSLDYDNPNFDIGFNENIEGLPDFKIINDIKKWVNENF